MNNFLRKKNKSNPSEGSAVPQDVGTYYNHTTDKFLAVYGDIIQAFRTHNVEDYLDYTIASARLTAGMKLLDAGCGICGPAAYFAAKLQDVSIEACTISSVQVEKGRENVRAKGLENQINITEGDYHSINELYPAERFDRVYFLESFGHSNDKRKLLHAAWEVLKPGGMVYIKDLFRRESDNEWEQLRIDHICGQINDAYKYHIADLGDVLSILRRKGYVLHYVKIPEVDRSQFENLTISNDFQNLFNIGKIDSWDDYVFPIDFYEILAEKPIQPTMEDMHLYFMNKKQ